jgi:tetratricopeptide (TPR) repeat protein
LSIAKDIVFHVLGIDISSLFPGYFSYPSYDSIYLRLVHTYLKKGVKVAIESIKKLLESHTKSNILSQEIHQFGQIILEQEDYENAINILKFANESCPESVPILIELAKAYTGNNQFDKSHQILNKARELNRMQKKVKDEDIDWITDWVKAIKTPMKLNMDYLEKLAGDYSDRHIRLKDGILYYFRENSSAGSYRKMYPLSIDTFVLKEISWFRLRFTKDKDGNIKKITGIRQDGGTDDSLRNLPSKKNNQ